MRAIIVRKFGHYQDVAKLENLPIPNPGPGEVVVQNKAAGVSFAMSLVMAGKYQRKPPLPFTPGTEAAGIIHSVGPGVTRVAVGDRVMCNVDEGGNGGFNRVRDICCHKISDDKFSINHFAFRFAPDKLFPPKNNNRRSGKGHQQDGSAVSRASKNKRGAERE